MNRIYVWNPVGIQDCIRHYSSNQRKSTERGREAKMYIYLAKANVKILIYIISKEKEEQEENFSLIILPHFH